MDEAFADYELTLMQIDAQQAGSDPLPRPRPAVEATGITQYTGL
ncbi:hypothetical protein [Corynebacterium pilosum]|nr:hypothetical protein [Corynebacterium pilosum]